MGPYPPLTQLIREYRITRIRLHTVGRNFYKKIYLPKARGNFVGYKKIQRFSESIDSFVLIALRNKHRFVGPDARCSNFKWGSFFNL